MLTRLMLVIALATASLNATADKWIVLGDSISAAYGMAPNEGWVTLLQARFDELEEGSHTVINASISGETTGGALARLPNLLEHHSDAQWIIIELGGNDGLRGYPIRMMRENLSKLVELSQESGLGVIVVGMQIPPNYGERYTQAFRDSYTQVAETYSTVLVETFIENVAFDASLMQSDGIHPTAEAQPLLLDSIWPTLQAQLEQTQASPKDDV